MKAILVIDVPKECFACPCWHYMKSCTDRDGKVYQNRCASANKMMTWEEAKKKPSWCPLISLPQKLDANDWHRMFSGSYQEREAKGYGYNACLDEILGEENE